MQLICYPSLQLDILSLAKKDLYEEVMLWLLKIPSDRTVVVLFKRVSQWSGVQEKMHLQVKNGILIP